MGANDLQLSAIDEGLLVKNIYGVNIVQENDGTYLVKLEGRIIVLLDEYCLEEFYALLKKHNGILSYLEKYGDEGIHSYEQYLNGEITTLNELDDEGIKKIDWKYLSENQDSDEKKKFIESLAKSYIQLPKALNLLFLFNQAHRTIGKEKGLGIDSSNPGSKKNNFLFFNDFNAGNYKKDLWKLLSENKGLDILLAFFDTQDGEDGYIDIYFSKNQRVLFDQLKTDISGSSETNYPNNTNLSQPINWNTKFLQEYISKLYDFCSTPILIESNDGGAKLFTNSEIAEALGETLRKTYSKTYPYMTHIVTEDLASGTIKILLWGGSIYDIYQGIQSGAACLIDDLSKKGDGIITEIGKLVNNYEKGSPFNIHQKLLSYFKDTKYSGLYMTTRNESGKQNGSFLPVSQGDKIPKGAGQRVSMLTDRLPEFQKLWGIAPWYIMANGTIELLDLRILLKKESEEKLRKTFENGSKVYFFNQKNGSIANTIIKDNIGLDFDILGDTEEKNIEAISNSTISLKYPESNSQLRAHGNVEAILEIDGKSTLSELDTDAQFLGVGIILFKLDVTDPTTISVQGYLEANGYYFTSIFPEQNKIYGYWFKNVKNTKLTEPFYTELENREKYLNKKGSNIILAERLLGRNPQDIQDL